MKEGVLCTHLISSVTRKTDLIPFAKPSFAMLRWTASDRGRKGALFSSLDDLQSDLYLQEISQDRYATYSKRYRVKGIDVTIENEEIGEALQYILPNQRAVLLLSFFKEYTASSHSLARSPVRVNSVP